MILTLLRLQGVSHKGYTSKPPVPEEREANRLHGEAVKKKKEVAEEAAARKRKRKRKEKHEKECKIARAEGKPRLSTPESTEEDSSDVELDFSDDDEAVTGAGSPPAYRGACGEGSTVTLGEATLAPGSLVEPPPVRTERRSPTPVVGRGSPMPAAGKRSSTPMTGQEVAPAGDG